MTTLRGSCACGAVRFAVTGDVPPPDACHCSVCRKTSGHFLVSTDVPRAALTVDGEEHVRWYASSAKTRRGFCDTCGAMLFWDAPAKDWIGVAMGAFDDSTGVTIGLHVHVASKGDYYAILDDAPQFEAVPAMPHA